MRRSGLVRACTMFCVCLVSVAALHHSVQAAGTGKPAAVRAPQRDIRPDLEEAAQQIIRRTNALRQDKGLPQITTNPRLMRTARDFAGFMARTGQYGHTADGQRPGERAMRHGYRYSIISENIATSYSSTGSTTAELVQRFFQGWQSSSGHRKNMLAPSITETGVAIAHSTKTGQYYAVQMFGRPV